MNKTTLVIRKLAIFSLFLTCRFGVSCSKLSSKIGINYGRIGDNLPPPDRSIELIKSMNAGGVKLYDADAEILSLLSGTNLTVSIMVRNDEIAIVASSQANSDNWIARNFLPHYPQTLIRYILVGNEILSYFSDEDRQNWFALVPAMNNLQNSLDALGINDVRIGTPMAMDVLESTFPPSAGEFRRDISFSVVLPILEFLSRTKSFFFVDVYPYFPWSENPETIALDFALMKRGNPIFYDPGTGLAYNNLLDQMLDAAVFAMARLGFSGIPLFIAETGWPTAGGGGAGAGSLGANVVNAAAYNWNVIERLSDVVPAGTPARPGAEIPTYIFSLFDEDLKGGAGVERHWGLLRADGSAAYEVDLMGRRGRMAVPNAS